MAIEVFPSGVNHVDASGRNFGIVSTYNGSAGPNKNEFSCKITRFQMAHPSIRNDGVPVTNLQLARAIYEKGKPFELNIESLQGFNNEAPYAAADGWHENPDYAEIRGRYGDMIAALERTLVDAGFAITPLEHRLNRTYPCHRIQFSPIADADKWSVAHVVRLLSEEGFIPRDIAREALKCVPAERAKLLESGELAAAYKMVAEAQGISVDSLMEHLERLPTDQPTCVLVPR